MVSRLFFLIHFSLIFVFIGMPVRSLCQQVNEENLTEKVRIYWDSKNRHLSSTGAYYTDDILGDTKEKHGKWKFYNYSGQIEEERHYFRDRIHGRQVKYYKDRSIQTESYFRFNVPDSTYKEWNESGTLILEGNYTLGSPDGEWKSYYEDGHVKKKKWLSNDTIYLLEMYADDSAHTQLIEDGNGRIEEYYISGGLKEFYTYMDGLITGLFEERLANGTITVQGEFYKGLKHKRWTYYSRTSELEEIINYQYDTLHGPYMSFFPGQRLKSKGSYLNGKKSGEWVWKMDTGKPEMEGGFQQGDQHGEWKYYFSSGELSYIAHFDRGKRSGSWHYYFIDGSTYKKGDYKNDLKSGRWFTNYENGQLLMSGQYINGLENGEWVNYWDNGTVKNRSYFKAGVLNGKWESRSPENKLLIEGEYKMGLKDGEWRTYGSTGKLLLWENFKIIPSTKKSSEIVVVGRKQLISVYHGKYEAYSEVDFKLKSVGVYKNGEKNGTFIDYYPGGVVPTVVAQYKKGRLNGLFQQFSRQGGIHHQIEYKNGEKNGSFLIFDSSGRVVVRKSFVNGVEIRN